MKHNSYTIRQVLILFIYFSHLSYTQSFYHLIKLFGRNNREIKNLKNSNCIFFSLFFFIKLIKILLKLNFVYQTKHDLKEFFHEKNILFASKLSNSG